VSLKYVRATYGVPAARGMRVTVDGKPGTITGADHGLRVRFDGERRSKNCHPTWRVDYGVAPQGARNTQRGDRVSRVESTVPGTLESRK
jgi:hypothetical protein